VVEEKAEEQICTMPSDVQVCPGAAGPPGRRGGLRLRRQVATCAAAGALIINMGDMLHMWTNGKWAAVLRPTCPATP
jgi:hypothetical protein